MKMKVQINGKEYIIHRDPETSLAEVLREDLGLLGTKEGCGSGECGCCTVLQDGLSVQSCILPVVSAVGSEIITIEGMSSREHPLHPIQEAFIEAGAIQCGYCTPGFVMASYALLKKNPAPHETEIKEGLSGNVCRCTGYETIVKAVSLAAEKMARGSR